MYITRKSTSLRTHLSGACHHQTLLLHVGILLVPIAVCSLTTATQYNISMSHQIHNNYYAITVERKKKNNVKRTTSRISERNVA